MYDCGLTPPSSLSANLYTVIYNQTTLVVTDVPCTTKTQVSSLKPASNLADMVRETTAPHLITLYPLYSLHLSQGKTPGSLAVSLTHLPYTTAVFHVSNFTVIDLHPDIREQVNSVVRQLRTGLIVPDQALSKGVLQ